MGTVSAEEAKQFAESEFEKYKPIHDKLFEFESDFDREIKKLLQSNSNYHCLPHNLPLFQFQL
jgi:hypothetical protein